MARPCSYWGRPTKHLALFLPSIVKDIGSAKGQVIGNEVFVMGVLSLLDSRPRSGFFPGWGGELAEISDEIVEELDCVVKPSFLALMPDQDLSSNYRKPNCYVDAHNDLVEGK